MAKAKGKDKPKAITPEDVEDLEFYFGELYGEDFDLMQVLDQEVATNRLGEKVLVASERTMRLISTLNPSDVEDAVDEEPVEDTTEAPEAAEEQVEEEEAEEAPEAKAKPKLAPVARMRRYTRAKAPAKKSDPSKMSPSELREQRTGWQRDGETVAKAAPR